MSEILAQINTHELTDKIALLQERLTTAHPLMPVLLREIHTTLRQQPDNITLLSEAEINVIVSGLAKQSQVTLSTKVMKTKTKSIKSIGVDDL